ncbi:MAG: hypothetical protein NT062_16690 [Proteobacteria bacterium]|nr:hypothetical protein [Pseudomonadota bacterium]
MTTIYLVALAFGLTLLVASLVLGGKDTDHGDGGHGHAGDVGFGWAPVASLRFWVFLLAFGGAAGLALTALGSSTLVAAIGAGSIGYAAGMIAVLVIRMLGKNSVSSESYAGELVGMTGTLVLPVAPGEPGKVRVAYKGRAEDFIANLANDDAALPTGTSVLIISKGQDDSVVVALDDARS